MTKPKNYREKKCALCPTRFSPRSGNAKYCDACKVIVRHNSANERVVRHRRRCKEHANRGDLVNLHKDEAIARLYKMARETCPYTPGSADCEGCIFRILERFIEENFEGKSVTLACYN